MDSTGPGRDTGIPLRPEWNYAFRDLIFTFFHSPCPMKSIDPSGVISKDTDTTFHCCSISKGVLMTTRIAVGMVFLSSVLLGASPAKSLYPDPSLPIVRSLSNRLAFLPSISQSVDSVGEIDVTLPGYKYPGKAMLYSLVVPGGGQLYAGRPKRTLFFLGAEVLAIATWSSYNRRGENKTLAYKDSADVHWDFRRWLLTAPTYVPPIWGTETESGQIYVGTQGTHHLEFFVDMDGDNRPEVYGNSKDHSERLYQLLADPDTSDYLYIKKSHEYYENIGKYNEFFSGWDDADPNNPDIEERKSGLIALGGGVVGDVAGFVASLYMRSIPYAQVPTTLLAQVDSSLGGKNGIDLPHGKNLLGTIYQPDRVYVDPAILQSLPDEEFRNGLAEVIKCAVIGDRELFQLLEDRRDAVCERQPEVLEEMVKRCCRLKSDIVMADEEDKGLRQILNFGHTVGHAIEAYAHYRVPHGLAVSLGMASETVLSTRMNVLPQRACERILEALQRYDLPTGIPKDYDTEKILNLMLSDKKAEDGRIAIVFPTAIGDAVVREAVPKEAISEALQEVRG